MEHSALTPAAPLAADTLPLDAVRAAMAARAHGAQAVTVHSEAFEVNFERAEPTLLRSHEQLATEITVFQDGKRGSGAFTGTEGLAEAVAAALSGAQVGVADVANVVVEDGPAEATWIHGEASCDRAAMVARVIGHLDEMRERFPLIRCETSHYTFTLKRVTFASSAGKIRRSQRGTYHFYTCFSGRDGDASASLNFTGGSAWLPFQRLMAVGDLERLLGETTQGLHARPADLRGPGDLIIAPGCVPTLVEPLVHALDGYNLLGGTTPYARSLGDAIASPSLTLRNRPGWVGFPDGADFDDEGVPTRELDIVTGGRLHSFVIDGVSSRKLGMARTAGRLNLQMSPGRDALASLVASTRRGILLGRFSGGRPNRNLDFSGVAKNAFYIEDGQIKHALSRTMVSGNLGELLRSIRGISRETINFGGGSWPWLAVSGATLSSE